MPDRPINILYFSSFGSLRWGGQKSLYNLVIHLDRGIFRPYVAVPTNEDLAERLKSRGIDVIILSLPRILDFKIHKCINPLLTLLKTIDRFHINLIHTDGPRNTFYAGLAAKIKGIPLVWHVRDSSRDLFDFLLYVLSSKIILVADSIRSRFKWALNADKIATIYNGVDMKSLAAKNALDISSRSGYGINENSFLIGVVARVEPLKGQLYLIEACGRLKEALPDFHLLMVGETADSAYLRKCERKAEDLGIRNRVHFMGYQNNVAGILNSLDLFVLPSLLEAFPRSVIEAMAMGKPVIVTDVGGSPEAVEPSVSGFVVPPRDPESLAERILFMGLHKESRFQMGEAARIRAREMFSLERNVSETVKVYRDVLEQSKKGSNYA